MVVADEIISEGSSSGSLHAESRSFLYQPISAVGTIASPTPGYDSINRLLQYQRGTLSGTGGYQNTGGGSITAPNALPGTNTQENWNLDGLGNWRATGFLPVGGSQTTDQRSHNNLNEIAQRTLTGSGAITFQYDGATGASNGNLKNDGTLIYAFDALNRPIQINRASGGAVVGHYVYDALNRRIRKTVSNGGLTGNVPNETTDYLNLANQVVEERDPFGGTGSTDTPIKQYIWGTYIDECIQLTAYTIFGPQSLPAGAYYLLQDLLYRAVALTNSNGAIVEAYDTDAYGNTLIFTGPGADGVWFTNDDVQSSYGASDIVYCGYRFDPEAELYYVRNRTYSPILGRWLQRDPIGYAGGVNLYEYVGGRAVVAVDPEGEGCGPCDKKADQWENPIDAICGKYHGIEWLLCEAFVRGLLRGGSGDVGGPAACQTEAGACQQRCALNFTDCPGDKLAACLTLCSAHLAKCVAKHP
ncbi:MAG: RHS repeat-associated core domain-containing protein [Phycisphaerae bacterium]